MNYIFSPESIFFVIFLITVGEKVFVLIEKNSLSLYINSVELNAFDKKLEPELIIFSSNSYSKDMF